MTKTEALTVTVGDKVRVSGNAPADIRGKVGIVHSIVDPNGITGRIFNIDMGGFTITRSHKRLKLYMPAKPNFTPPPQQKPVNRTKQDVLLDSYISKLSHTSDDSLEKIVQECARRLATLNTKETKSEQDYRDSLDIMINITAIRIVQKRRMNDGNK